MNSHHKINYLEFGAKDLRKLRVFYENAFGWTFTDYGPSYLGFSDGEHGEGGFTTQTAPGKGALVILYSERLEESLATVTTHGGSIVGEGIFDFPGGRRFHFNDPDGNELAVWSDK